MLKKRSFVSTSFEIMYTSRKPDANYRVTALIYICRAHCRAMIWRKANEYQPSLPKPTALQGHVEGGMALSGIQTLNKMEIQKKSVNDNQVTEKNICSPPLD